MRVLAKPQERFFGAELIRHCEEPTGPALLGRPDDKLRDEAIHLPFCGEMDCFASLAMTNCMESQRGQTNCRRRNRIRPMPVRQGRLRDRRAGALGLARSFGIEPARAWR